MKSLASSNQQLGQRPTTIKKAPWIASFVLLAFAAVVLIGTDGPALGQAPTDLVVYDDALASGWHDRSWDTTVDLLNTSLVYSGTASIAATYNGSVGWAVLERQLGRHQRLRHAALLAARRQRRRPGYFCQSKL